MPPARLLDSVAAVEAFLPAVELLVEEYGFRAVSRIFLYHQPLFGIPTLRRLDAHYNVTSSQCPY